MTSLKLYKILQNHVGRMNSLAIRLSMELIIKDDAKEQAGIWAKELTAALNDE